MIEIKQNFMDQLRALRAKGVSLQIAEDLIWYPMLTVKDAADRYGVTYQAANQAVAKLVELGILQQWSCSPVSGRGGSLLPQTARNSPPPLTPSRREAWSPRRSRAGVGKRNHR